MPRDFVTNVPIIELPLDPYLSKNRKMGIGKWKYYKHPKHKKAQDTIIHLVRAALKGKTFPKNKKLWLYVYVYKSMTNSDAHNVIDGLFDAIEKAIGVRYSWFSIWCLDWAIDKNNPRILLQIGEMHELSTAF